MNNQIIVSGCFGDEYINKRTIKLNEKNVKGNGPSHDRTCPGEALTNGSKHGGMATDDAVGNTTCNAYEREQGHDGLRKAAGEEAAGNT